jgi:hypothetical protein
MAVLNWTCVGCGHVNFISVEQKQQIMDKFNPEYTGNTEIIKCENCKSQASIQVRLTHDTGR